MLIYLAAQSRRRLELCGYQADLETLGHIITSRWLRDTHEVEENGSTPLVHKTDVARAQLVIAFTEPPRSPASKGGRHFEAGMAYAWGKMLWVVGPREHVFYHLNEVRQFDTWAQCLAALHTPVAV